MNEDLESSVGEMNENLSVLLLVSLHFSTFFEGGREVCYCQEDPQKDLQIMEVLY